ncbi:MAG: T9SS type A sorting domain-containing protein, partial [Flavobacteriaceae bacterium]
LCADALTINCDDTVTGSTAEATTDNQAFCGTSNTAPGVWYKFAGDGSEVTASLCGSSYDTKISVYRGSCGSLVCEGGNDDSCGLQSEVTFDTETNNDYYILVHGFGSSSGDYTLNLTCIDCVAAVVTGEVEEDCANDQFFINVNVAERNDGTSINYGIESVEMPPDGGFVQLGPFPVGASPTVVISHDNSEDPDPLGSACNYELGTFSAACPPPNDQCPQAIDVGCNSEVSGTTIGANDAGEGGFCGTSPGDSGVWYTFTGTGGNVRVSTDNPGTDYDTKLNVYSGSCEALACVGGNDDGGTGLTSELTFASVEGETYYIYVNGFTSNTGNFVLSVDCQLIADIAEDCTTVYTGYAPTACTDITVDTQFGVEPLSYLWNTGETTATITACPSQTTTYSVVVTDAAGNEAGDQTTVVVVDVNCDTNGNENKVEVCHKGTKVICVSASAVQAHLDHGDSLGACDDSDLTCDTAPGCDSIITPADGAIDVATGVEITWTTASGYIEGYTISVGTSSGGTDVADNVDVGLDQTYDPGTLEFDTTYYVTVTAYNSNGSATGCEESSFTTELDPCTTAAAIACGDSVSGSTVGLSSNSDVGFCGTTLTTAPGAWYEFVGTGDIINVNTAGSSFDTKLGVFTGDCDALVCVDGDDDVNFPSDPTSEVEFESVAGTVYKIYVTGFSANAGDYNLNVNCVDPPNEPIDLQGSNDCADAPQVTCGQPVNGTTVTFDDSNPIDCGTVNTAPGVWYKLDGPGGNVTVSTCNNANFDTKLSIYSGDCASLTCVAGNDDGIGCSGFSSEVSFNTSAGTTYYIYVHGFGSASGDFTLSVTCDAAPIANPIGNGETISWGMSPNPSIGVVNVDLKNFLNTDVTIDVLDFTGKVLSTLRLEDIQNPRYRMQLSETLTNGMYMVRLSSDLQSSAKRLILNR